jgi:hypothetical protein
VAHVHKPNYLEAEIGGLWFEASQGKYFLRPPHLQTNQSKMDWGCGSSECLLCFAIGKP